ncbi:hypothetical protein [Bradyrhizobium sp. HKCCYLS20291]|uniref:hypothetical protein n=1 Tax=Bradyrhizobium sp. HKCCYLS20291 TaxID=3420766 RepID=UPI003EB7920F
MDFFLLLKRAALTVPFLIWQSVAASDAIAQSGAAGPVVPRILTINDYLLSKTTSYFAQLVNSNTGDTTPIPNADAFAELVLTTSSVEMSSGGRYAVLFSTFADLYTVLKYDDQKRVSAIYFAGGHSLGKRISAGSIKDDDDFKLRLFRQRPKLQRDLARLLFEDESSIIAALSELQRDKAAAKEVVRGLLLQVQGMQEYERSPCREAVEVFRSSETFATRFSAGKAAAAFMKPRALVRISEADNFVLQDDQVGRETAFIEVGAAPNGAIRRVRILLSY